MIRILLFAEFREAVGMEVIMWHDLPITVTALKNRLQQQYADLPCLDSVMIAVNEQYANDDTDICEGDTVALIPPVSGG